MNGTIATFDEAVGLGEVEPEDGQPDRVPLHRDRRRIADDRSRDRRSSSSCCPKLGRYEATAIRPR